MSSLQVQESVISSLEPHPNADRLELATVLGWQVVVGKGNYEVGAPVVYFPPDTILPEKWIEEFGIGSYTKGGRIKASKIRGESSFGFVTVKPDVEVSDWAEYFSATKYQPPLMTTVSDALPDNTLFPRYTDVENLRNFPGVFREDDYVTVTEKIHGTNSRLAVINGELLCGSRTVNRIISRDPKEREANLYSFPLTLEPVIAALVDLGKRCKQVVFYGEVYGKVQSLRYGLKNGLGYRIFDILIDGHFIQSWVFDEYCESYSLPRVPVLYTGKYSLPKIRELSSGKSTIPGADHIREGVVVKPFEERIHPKIGRIVLKYINDSYLLGNHSDFTDV